MPNLDRRRSVSIIVGCARKRAELHVENSLLQQLDAHYPKDVIIRVVLDNHSAHISKETMAYLSGRPGRFEYVHPISGS